MMHEKKPTPLSQSTEERLLRIESTPISLVKLVKQCEVDAMQLLKELLSSDIPPEGLYQKYASSPAITEQASKEPAQDASQSAKASSDRLDEDNPTSLSPQSQDEGDASDQFKKIPQAIRSQYIDFMQHGLRDELDALTAKLNDEAQAILTDKFVQIEAAASFSQMKLSATLASKVLSYMSFSDPASLMNPQARQDLQERLSRSVDVLWEILRFVESSESEEEFWSNEQSQKNYLRLINDLIDRPRETA